MMASDGLVLALLETGGDPIAFLEHSGLDTPDWVWGLQAWFGPLATFNAAARAGRDQRDFLVCLAEAGRSLRRTEVQ